MENGTQAAELSEWYRERDALLERIGGFEALAKSLAHEREMVLVASAEALIAGVAPFDLRILSDLDARLAQARKAVELLNVRFHADFVRSGPSISHPIPALYTRI